MPDYVIWDHVRDETHVRIQDRPREVERKYELLQGVPRLETWPESVVLDFSKHRAEGLFLPDTVDNAFGWILVSGACKAALDAVPDDDVEFLPVTIRNHRGRVASDDYWIVNVLRLVEAVDRQRSEFEPDAADPSQIFRIDRLVLDPSVVADGPPLFRLAERPRLVLLRADLAEQVEAAGLTGNVFVPVDEYSTFPRPAS